MLPFDPSGKQGPKKHLPDAVSIVDPKEEEVPAQPYSEQKGAKPTDAQPQPGAPVAAQAPGMGAPSLGAGPPVGAGPPSLGAGPPMGGPPPGAPLA